MIDANDGPDGAGDGNPRRLFVYSAGFLTQSRVRRILALAGWRVTLGRPGKGDHVGIWGASPVARRGAAIAGRYGAGLVRIEDAFLRSLHPGRLGEPPLGLLIDRTGLHFDARGPSDLETLLRSQPFDETAELARARAVIARLRAAQLTKYAATRTDLPPPDPGYVLVIDQVRGDASVRADGAGRARFLEMLTVARQENPGARIVLRTHPETARGLRPGHFAASDCGPGITMHDAALSPWALLDGAVAVYTHSSQMGFEAILAGHRPRVFGTPFYAGWGLSVDEHVFPRRTRTLTRAQLVAGALIRFPAWYDPFTDRLCAIEDVLAALEASVRAWREDRCGWVASGMRLWKRGPIQRYFGGPRGVRFDDDAPRAARNAARTGARHMVWGALPAPDGAARVEDGFLRSRGLGAALVPPLSLVVDEAGLYYDASRPSGLERLIAGAHALRPDQTERARALIAQVIGANVTKYNLSGALPALPDRPRVLVVGQVEDDASIRLGAGGIRTNAELLEAARAAHPDAAILWKPHPDVEAGLRPGHVDTAARWADVTLSGVPVSPLYAQMDRVWTITSLAGFEALLRGVPVTVLGAPFYAGWGLTDDRGPVPARRLAGPRPGLEGLVHAALIDYPRYRDPVTGQPCPPEIAIARLVSGAGQRPPPALRLLAKVQGAFAGHARLWRSGS